MQQSDTVVPGKWRGVLSKGDINSVYGVCEEGIEVLAHDLHWTCDLFACN